MGSLDEEGVLTVSNMETGTPFSSFGTEINERCKIMDVTDEGFTFERENSFDGGENWFVSEKLTYTRKSE